MCYISFIHTLCVIRCVRCHSIEPLNLAKDPRIPSHEERDRYIRSFGTVAMWCFWHPEFVCIWVKRLVGSRMTRFLSLGHSMLYIYTIFGVFAFWSFRSTTFLVLSEIVLRWNNDSQHSLRHFIFHISGGEPCKTLKAFQPARFWTSIRLAVQHPWCIASQFGKVSELVFLHPLFLHIISVVAAAIPTKTHFFMSKREKNEYKATMTCAGTIFGPHQSTDCSSSRLLISFLVFSHPELIENGWFYCVLEPILSSLLDLNRTIAEDTTAFIDSLLFICYFHFTFLSYTNGELFSHLMAFLDYLL